MRHAIGAAMNYEDLGFRALFRSFGRGASGVEG